MDILAARKKAAEKARSRQSSEAGEPGAPSPTQGATAPRADEPIPEAPSSLPAPAAPPADAGTDKATEEAGDRGEAEQPPPLEEIELLSFRLGGEHYAVMVHDVREVLKLRDLTPVPNTPAYLLGITSLRGAMLPVIDLCARLGLTPGVRDEKSRIVVVSHDEEDTGLLVDRVTGVFRIAPDAVRPAPENIEQGAGFLRGIVRKDEKLYILLDLQKTVGA